MKLMLEYFPDPRIPTYLETSKSTSKRSCFLETEAKERVDGWWIHYHRFDNFYYKEVVEVEDLEDYFIRQGRINPNVFLSLKLQLESIEKAAIPWDHGIMYIHPFDYNEYHWDHPFNRLSTFESTRAQSEYRTFKKYDDYCLGNIDGTCCLGCDTCIMLLPDYVMP